MPVQVYEAKWWAGLYGSPTLKRHIAWSNSPTVALLDIGRMTKRHQERIAKKGVKSATTGRTKRGRKIFTGTAALKSTQ